MKRVRHPHVLSMHELFESKSCLWMILELADGGDLLHAIKRHQVFSEADASFYLKQIFQAVHYLHQIGGSCAYFDKFYKQSN